ncbi:hypothetical protein [Aneurinibacillus terranovensis]|uniref:hypothetical protein n=1 Tax=Aneurinibacillus terranovensis TaxID=278991 RepID=UPI0003F7E252|nr:hypothetical protein [Aneurinibacillus terranovensis]
MKNLLTWIVVIFIVHLALYYFLGTRNWFSVAILATAVWGIVLYAARYFFGNKRKERA